MANKHAGKSLADLVAEYNALASAAGKNVVKKFESKAVAEARIAALAPAKPKRAAKPTTDANGADVAPRVTIKSIAVPLIAADTDKSQTEAIIATVKAQFPESAFNAKHVAWYRGKLKSGAIVA